MEIYECILSLISGIGVFILAMKLLSDSLKDFAGEKMKSLLKKITGNRIKGVLIGALVTGVVQSSAVTTLMVIGFVNANIMDLYQAAAVIIGANIGTTTTGLLASLESFNISLYLSLFCFIGVMLAFIKKFIKIANLLIGLGMVFVGLELMSSSCDNESIKSGFKNAFEKISFPLLLELLGIIFTAILQSSSAMTGLVIVMISNQAINIQNALFITLGANIGSCVTALIGIIGTNINSKRTAIIHLTFNILGCALFTPILWIFTNGIVNILKAMVSKEGMQIAIFHLFFNCITAIITTPLIKYLVKFSEFVIKDKNNKGNILEKLIENVDDIGDMIRNDDSTNTSFENNEDFKEEKDNENNNEKNFNINDDNDDDEENEINGNDSKKNKEIISLESIN